MTEWQILRRRVALAGLVTSGRTGAPEKGASVRLVKASPALKLRLETLQEVRKGTRGAGRPPPDETFTAADGTFFFMDLPPGDYEVAAESGIGPSRRRSKAVSVELVEQIVEEEDERRIPHVELTLKESR